MPARPSASTAAASGSSSSAGAGPSTASSSSLALARLSDGKALVPNSLSVPGAAAGGGKQGKIPAFLQKLYTSVDPRPCPHLAVAPLPPVAACTKRHGELSFSEEELGRAHNQF